MKKAKTAEYRELLISKRREISGEVDAVRQDRLPAGDGVLDSGDEAAQAYAQEVAANIGETERALLREIDDALDRMDAGEYGECGGCGEKIADGRLKAVPWASLCVACKSEEERNKR